jgi:hypothetical protein
MLATRIRDFWAALGFDVKVTIEHQGQLGAEALFGVRSNLRSGLPRITNNIGD